MIGAVIPTRYHPPTLDPLKRVLHGDGVYTIVFESEDFGHELYVMWNEGVRRLKARGFTDIAILNDDIEMAPGTLAVMAEALRMDDRVAMVGPERGDHHAPKLPARVRPRREDRNFGYAFMFKAELPLPEFDEGYHIHRSDIDWENQIREMGLFTARVEGLYIKHMRSYSLKKLREEDPQVVADDYARMRQLHPPPPVPPPGRRWSWEQERRLRKAGR